eukprot:TRINITY_DN15006_c0_g1_i1.p1 TRINITY_DN15006_c0_g1~~TRINITY_DN15006_c0_g1_i1.p1  ORF type:complete len:577 (+),score=144.50 TRINITY_DN15006_c0_g1_i1:70-1731(+)
MLRGAAALAALAAHSASAVAAKRPNIVFFLTDDQDQMLGGSFPEHGGVTPMPKARALLAKQGSTATNFFIHTPVCCPSRAETLTGRYFHNVKTEGKCTEGYGSAASGCCFHVDTSRVLNQTFAATLSAAGYTVGLFGKFLNSWPGDSKGPAPPGFDAWLANGGGSYYQPSFAAQGVADLGFPDGAWHGKADDYSTAVIGNASVKWIRKVGKGSKPFFAYIAPKACHEPFAPASWYADYWDPSWPQTEPRPESWNSSAESRKKHHRIVAVAPMINPGEAEQITLSFKDRWRTLMSVDDVVGEVLQAVTDLQAMKHTYFISSSDHGFQLGEFNFPIDKRQPYDHTTRIHLLVRGPGVAHGSSWGQLATNVDLAPTFLGLAGLDKPSSMDGKSLLPLLLSAEDTELPPATAEHLSALGPRETYRDTWRDAVYIEYYDVGSNVKCMPYSPLDPVKGHGCHASDPGCTCTEMDDPSNNFIALRHMAGEFGNTLYAEFQTSKSSDVRFDDPDTIEYFRQDKDPWSMRNLYDDSSANRTALQLLHTKLHAWFNCQGAACP